MSIIVSQVLTLRELCTGRDTGNVNAKSVKCVSGILINGVPVSRETEVVPS